MSLRSNGSYIGPRPTGPTNGGTGVASGIWDLRTAQRQRAANAWPFYVEVDPLWSNVVLLMHGDGGFSDSSSSPKTVNGLGGANISTSVKKFGSGSIQVGGGKYVTVNRHASLIPQANQDFTIEAWIYLTEQPATNAHILGFHEGGQYAGWLMFVQSTTLKVGVYIDAGYSEYLNPTPITLNQWHHVAVSRSGTGSGNIKVFVNGDSGNVSFTNNAALEDSSGNTPPLSIGADQNGDEAFFTGFIDDLRITVGNGGGRYTANFTPPTAAFPDA